MFKNVFPLFTAFLFALALPIAPALAQATRTFISANGNDANTCVRSAPCRTLQVAHDKTNSGGEINMLDPAGYGPVTITKPISIVNDGVGSAGILVPSGGVGITINTASALDRVHLRGLIIEGAGAGQTGIQFLKAKSLTIENCVIRNLTNDGIDFIPSGIGDVSMSLAVTNTLISDNGVHGISIQPGNAITVDAVFDRVNLHYNGGSGVISDGSLGTAAINATAKETVADYNGYGFQVISPGGQATTNFLLLRSLSANNSNVGVLADGANATIRYAASAITGNNSGWINLHSSVVQTYGDNYLDGNKVNNGVGGATLINRE
jgi:hypothetical protein